MRRLAGALLLAGAVLAGCDKPQPEAPTKPAVPAPAPTHGSPPNRAARLAAAVKAVPAVPADSPIAFDDDKLVDTPFGAVLLRHGHVKDFGHGDTGVVNAFYLKPQGDGFTLAHAWPEIIQSGSMGDFGEWYVSRTLARYPVVGVEGGGTWQGCTVSFLTLVELRPEGPAQLADVPLLYDDSGMVEDGARHIKGRLTDPVPDKGFTLRYEGTERFAERYVRQGSKFVLEHGGESRVPGC
jgi:hypothetical protein